VLQLVASSPKSFSRVINADFSRTHILVRTTLARSSDITTLSEMIESFAKRTFPPELRARPTGNLILMTRTAGNLVSGQISSLATSTFVPLQQFGLLSAVTILAAIIAELVLFPALLATTRIITLWDLLAVKLGKDPHKTIPLFANLRPSQARIVALMAGLESYAKGGYVLRQGEVGHEMFVIIDGNAEVFVSSDGQHRKVRDLARGDVFGEMGLIRSHQRTADVVAAEPLEVMTVDERALGRIQRRYPRTAAQIFLNLAKILSDRLQTETARTAA
jgi:hypothetical protein